MALIPGIAGIATAAMAARTADANGTAALMVLLLMVLHRLMVPPLMGRHRVMGHPRVPPVPG
jgi:hypothetical protein